MIYNIDINNLKKINNSFINTEYIKKELQNNPFAKVLIYEENNDVIGYIYYSEIYDRVEINQIEIKNIHRNCGKGDFFLKEFIKIVDKNISLEVNKENIPAIKLYEKNGFKKEAIRKGYYNGIDGILMNRNKDS